MKKISEFDRSTLGIIGLILAIITFLCVNIIAAFALKNYRMDLTQAQLYSLSSGSKQALERIQEPLTFRFFLSSRLATASQIHASYAIRVLELLEQYTSEADGKIKLEIIDPEPFSKSEDEALSYGIKGIPVGNSSEFVYMGLVIMNSADRTKVIPLLDPSRERFLEYDITKNFADLIRTKRPTIGIISTLPIDGRGEPQLMYPKYHPRWAIMKQIRDIFNVRFISRQILDIPQDVDVLMLVNPKKFTEETLYAIDQYLMRGGNMMVLIDPFSEVEVTLGEMPHTVTPDLNKFFDKWGIAFDTKRFVGDLTLARTASHTENTKSMQVKFLPWIGLKEGYLSPEDPVTGALASVNLSYAGHFAVTNKVDGLSITPLMFSSSDAQLIQNNMGLSPDPLLMLRNFKASGKNYILGLRIKGIMESVFEAAPVRNFLNERTDVHMEKSVKPVNVILISDSDFLADKYWATQSTVLGVEQIDAFAGNGDLIINALDNLSDSASLIDLRSKAEWRRPFTIIEEMARKSSKEYREQETILFEQLSTVQARLQQLTEGSSKENGDILTREDLVEMQQLQETVIQLRSALRSVQSVLSKDIVSLQSYLIFLNVAFVPILLVFIAFFVAWRRRSRRVSQIKKG